MVISRRIVLLGLGAVAAAGPARPASELSPADTADVTRVIDYLQGLSAAEGRFTQTDARGAEARGRLFLQRPGKARFDYDPPSGLAIVSDGQEVTEVDRRLRTIRAFPLGRSPLALLLGRTIPLGHGVSVTQVIRGAGSLRILAGAGHGRGSAIALDFTDPPLALAGWSLTGARGGGVTVRLEGFGPAEPRDAGFFKLADPRARDASPP